MGEGGNPRRVLRAARAHRPIVLHGVSMSLGSTDPLDLRYLNRLAALAAEIEPAWIWDHLLVSFGGRRGHDLWPLPFTEEALAHVAARVARVQERLGRRILVENVSSYLTFRHSTMSEPEFLAALADRADCGLLLDINNVFVSAHIMGSMRPAFSTPSRASASDSFTWPGTRHCRLTCATRTIIRCAKAWGSVSSCPHPVRRRRHADRAGRSHPAAGGALRGGSTRGGDSARGA